MSLISAITIVVLLAVLYVIVLPLIVFSHELGHAIIAIIVTNSPVAITLGEEPYWKRTIGRITISVGLFSGWVGFCQSEGQMTSRQYAIFSLAGPIASLLVCLGAFTVLASAGGWVEFLLWGVFYGAASQFLVTIIPIRYPSWWTDTYAGMPSDGHRAIYRSS